MVIATMLSLWIGFALGYYLRIGLNTYRDRQVRRRVFSAVGIQQLNPARSVDEINIKNWVDTGLTTPFSRYRFDVQVKWTGLDGVQHVHGPQTYTFPNDLSDMPLAVRRRFAEEMIQAKVRVFLGINEWENYS